MTDRLVIVGGPKTGKTTMVKQMGREGVRHTDDVIHMGWSAASEHIATWFDRPGPWVVEGVATARALRKWLAAHKGKPCDRVIFLSRPLRARSSGQITMAKGVEAVWHEIVGELRARGVEIDRL